MQMMSVLKPIAFDVLICLSQLFDYYLYAVSLLLKVLSLFSLRDLYYMPNSYYILPMTNFNHFFQIYSFFATDLDMVSSQLPCIFTASVQSTTGDYIFSLFFCLPGGEGTPVTGPRSILGEGYLSLWSQVPSGRREYPGQDWGTPSIPLPPPLPLARTGVSLSPPPPPQMFRCKIMVHT